MARDVRDGEIAEKGNDSDRFGARVRAAVAESEITPEERHERMTRDIERCREMHRRILEEIGEPLPDGWAAKMVREGRP